MDQAITTINAAVSGTLAGAIAWAILSRRVKDGVVIKVGLILLALGCAVTCIKLIDGLDNMDLLALNRARLLAHAGLLVVLVGYWLHLRAGRKVEDIITLVDQP